MAKQTVIFLPGMLCDERLWEEQAKGIADWAESMTMLPIGSDRIGGLAENVLAKAPPRFALAGLSLGGYIAMEIMRMAPERVTRLALLDTTPLPDTPERTVSRQDVIARVERGEFRTVYEEMLLPRLVHGDRLSDKTLVGAVRDMAMALGPDVFVQQTRAVMGRSGYVSDLQAIRCPTVVVCGRQDAICPLADHRLMAETIPGAKLVAVDDCGHLSSVERPQAVTAVLQYWLQS